MHNRVSEIEVRLKSFNERLPDLEEELKKVSSELLELMVNVEDNAETRLKIDELDARVEKLEEEVFAFV